jgi:hypothetical protein
MQNYSTPITRVQTPVPNDGGDGIQDKDDTRNKTVRPKKYQKHHADNMVRFNLCISRELLKKVDAAAEQDYTTRSDIIRAALLWYLRPQGRELAETDPDVILKTLEHRRALVSMKETMRGVSMFND